MGRNELMLQPLSNGGKRASRSGYRTVRKSSEVDETLFGITKPGDTNKQRADPSARVETFQSGGIVSPQAVESDATVLRSYDIARRRLNERRWPLCLSSDGIGK